MRRPASIHGEQFLPGYSESDSIYDAVWTRGRGSPDVSERSLATVVKTLVRRRLGRLDKSDWDSALSVLKTTLGE
jgi:hypothetical protein